MECLAEYAVCRNISPSRKPRHCRAPVTAWVALTGHRRVTAGDTVLTQGSGGVAVFALQFARLLGARVIAMTSTAEKAERLKPLGASDVIHYSETPDWDAKARELTDARGIDCLVEIGGPRTIAMSLGALAVGGHVSLIGANWGSVSTSARWRIPVVVGYAPARFRGDESGCGARRVDQRPSGIGLSARRKAIAGSAAVTAASSSTSAVPAF